jgi:polysaccharide biosynthesis/export protein
MRSIHLALSAFLAFSLAACSSGPKHAESGAPEKRVGDDSVQAMTSLPDVAPAGSGTVVLRQDDYRIGPADELHVAIFQAEELSGAERVNSRGYIRMPLLGPVKVGGLTREQAEALIAGLYGAEYLQDPQVNIDITEYASQQVTVIGAIEKPGVYPLKGQTTLLEVLAMSGGVTGLAADSEIVVFRTNAEGEVVGYVVDLDTITSGEKRDPKIIGNDSVVVPESGSMSAVKGVTDTLRGFVGFERY